MSGLDYTSNSQSVPFRKNAGGLNSTFSPPNLEDNEASDLLNIDFDKSGAIVKRSGYAQLNTTAFNSGGVWTGLKWLERSDGNKYLIGICGNKICSATSLTQAATPFTDRTGGITITAGQNNMVSSAAYLDYALFANDVDLPFQCNGSSNATAMVVPTNVTTAKFVEVFANHVFIANVTLSGVKQSSRVYWYEIDSITSILDTSYRNVSQFDGQDITGLKTFGGSLVIFKNRSIWIASFTGDSDIPFVFQQTRSAVGCDAPYSIQEVENGLIFHSYDGYYFFDGNNSYKMSYRITSTLNDMATSRFPYMPSVYLFNKNRYITAETTSGGSENDKCITWDSFNNAFSLYDGIAANCFARVYSSGTEMIFFGDYDGYVYQMDTGTSDNPPFTLTTDTISFVAGAPDTIKDSGLGFNTALVAGDKVTIAGSTSNDGTYTLAGTTTTGVLTLTVSGTLTNEAAGDSVTVTSPRNVETAINGYYYTKWYDYGDMVAKKANPQIAIYHQYSDSDLTLAYSYNYNSSDQYTQTVDLNSSGGTWPITWGTTLWGSSGGAVAKRHLTGRGEVVRFGFKNNTLAQGFTVNGFGLFAHAETNVK